MFRRLVASAKKNHLSIEQDAAHVVLNCDDRFIGQLVPMTTQFQAACQDNTNAMFPERVPNWAKG
jgi:hypothetical protein